PTLRRSRPALFVETAVIRLARDDAKIALDHILDKNIERGARLPAEHLLGLRCIADQEIDLSRAEIARIDLDQHFTRLGVQANLVDPLAAPFQANADDSEGRFDKRLDGAGLARRENEVVG